MCDRIHAVKVLFRPHLLLPFTKSPQSVTVGTGHRPTAGDLDRLRILRSEALSARENNKRQCKMLVNVLIHKPNPPIQMHAWHHGQSKRVSISKCLVLLLLVLCQSLLSPGSKIPQGKESGCSVCGRRHIRFIYLSCQCKLKLAVQFSLEKEIFNLLFSLLLLLFIIDT